MSNIVNLMIIFLIFILVSLFFYQVFRVSPEESITMSAILIMVGTFLTGLIGKADLIYYFLIIVAVLGAIAFIANFSFVAHDKATIIKRLFVFINPSIACLMLMFLYAVIAFKGALFTYPDEIMQWGPAVRYMVETGSLPYGDGFSGADITLSTATMFQYIWTGFVPFIERNCIVGNFLLTFIPVYLPLSGMKWKDWKKAIFYTAAIFLSINVLTYVKYYVLLQDLVLPMWTGGVIAWLLWEKEERINWWLLLGALMCIGSMKSMVGPLFAGIIIIVLIVRQILSNQMNIKRVLNLKTILLSISTMIAVISLSVVWSCLIHTNAYNRFTEYDLASKNIVEIFRNVINRAFISNATNNVFPNISFATLFMLIVLIISIVCKLFIDEKRQHIFNITFGLYAVGFGIFLGIMFFSYISIFGSADSELVAGLERYFSYYMLIGVVPLVSMFCLPIKMIPQKTALRFKVGILLLLILGINDTFVNKVSAINIKQDVAYKDRMTMKKASNRLSELTDDAGKVFVYGVLSSEKSKMLSWELGDRFQWNCDCYKYYQRTMSDLVILCDVEKYPYLLQERGYEYLWCYGMDGDDDYNLKYRYVMKNVKNGALYKIEYLIDKINLQYLGNTQETD